MFYPMKPPSESPVGSVSSNGEKFLSPLLASHLTKIKPEQTKCFTVFELSSLLLRCVAICTGTGLGKNLKITGIARKALMCCVL